MSRALHLTLEVEQDVFEERERPSLFEESLGRHVRRERFGGEDRIQCVRVDRDQRLPAPALLAVSVVALVGEEVLDRAEQEGAEASPLTTGLRDPLTGEQRREEALSQIAGGVRIVPPAADVGEDGGPVGLAERRQRVPALRLVRRTCLEDDAPVGRLEPRPALPRGRLLPRWHVPILRAAKSRAK